VGTDHEGHEVFPYYLTWTFPAGDSCQDSSLTRKKTPFNFPVFRQHKAEKHHCVNLGLSQRIRLLLIFSER